ncbi:MAG: pseudouridine synthase [Sphingobacteriales bacterium]|nr:MAG: pseudouridine synthase [Sphingobacteriales bacterium]
MKTSYRYLLFHKPFEVLSQFSEDGNKRTLAAFFPDLQKDVYPVGRLDYDSEGLLLLTNDKRLTHRLLDPSQVHPRTYWVQVEGVPSEAALKQLRAGVGISINGKKHQTLPAGATLLPEPIVPERNPPIRYRAAIPTSWIELTLTEGKNRQVRRMTAAVGFPTLRLIRVAIGNLQVGTLQPGDWREVAAADLF